MKIYFKNKKVNQFIVLFLITSLGFNLSLFSQSSGSNSYQFLDLANSSRIQALGGSNISIYDKDVNLTVSNPALLDSTQSGSISINYMNYISDINYGFTSYTHHVDNLGTFNAVFLYGNYGSFTRADENGDKTGKFVANDLSVLVGYGRRIDSLFSVGANLKFFNSVYDVYNSNGLALDLAANYYKPSKYFSMSLMLKNMGVAFSKFNGKEKMPFEIQLGMTKKLKYAPLRFSVTLNNLQKWDLTYIDPNAETQFDPNTFQELPPEEPSFLDKASRHIVFGTEFLLGKNFHLQIGYNFRRRAELKFAPKSGLVGFSGGIAFKIKKFHLNYSLASYHLAGASHSFSITTNLSNFRSKN
ncbi:MAG: type IX secretion system protein PorQ [Flavobacteriales bacterium]